MIDATIILALAATLALAQLSHVGEKPPAFPEDVEMHRFCWEPAPNSDWCHVYAAELQEPWYAVGMEHSNDPCWLFDARNDLPAGMIFLVVTCSNEYGESPTEHGDFPGDG